MVACVILMCRTRAQKRAADGHDFQLAMDLPARTPDLLLRAFPDGAVGLWNVLPRELFLDPPRPKGLGPFKSSVYRFLVRWLVVVLLLLSSSLPPPLLLLLLLLLHYCIIAVIYYPCPKCFFRVSECLPAIATSVDFDFLESSPFCVSVCRFPFFYTSLMPLLN